MSSTKFKMLACDATYAASSRLVRAVFDVTVRHTRVASAVCANTATNANTIATTLSLMDSNHAHDAAKRSTASAQRARRYGRTWRAVLVSSIRHGGRKKKLSSDVYTGNAQLD